MAVYLDMEFDFPVSDDAQNLMRKVADACVKAENVTVPAQVHILVTGNEHIREINEEYRGIDSATDVLSFPSVSYAKGKTAGASKKRLLREKDPETGNCFLGDMIISLPRAEEQAREYGHSLTRELGYLTAHSMFHLMGYDHMEEEEKRSMRAMEEKALSSIGISRVTDDELLQMAREAMENSYSPYSKYAVGAALLCEDGNVFTGCNVENASYGLTNCAERTAIFKAVSEGKQDFVTIAIASHKSAPWPCGACRQVLNEFAPHIRVLVTWQDHVEKCTLDQLLPHAFGPKGEAVHFLG